MIPYNIELLIARALILRKKYMGYFSGRNRRNRRNRMLWDANVIPERFHGEHEKIPPLLGFAVHIR